jgi:uncharacterized protein
VSDPLTDLGEILASLDVTVRPDPYVFAVVDAGSPVVGDAPAVIVEDEGVTVVVTTARARDHDLADAPAFAWLTLTVHSSLDAVGLTAVVSGALADAGISCNVLAGYHHDHLLVPWAARHRAVAVLRALRPPA